MNEIKLTWRERTSESRFIASVWVCDAPVETTRTILADPCISIALVKEGGNATVVLNGPETRPRSELLAPGYVCTAIRLQPGVILKGFPTQKFINASLVFPADSGSRFWYEGVHLQFPSFDDAELLIDQLSTLGYLSYETSSEEHPRRQGLSSRSYARLTKRTTGLSPYKLHQLQRVHEALRLLKQGMPAVAVAAELDFVDQAHLTHAVKQFLGHTPKELPDLPQNP